MKKNENIYKYSEKRDYIEIKKGKIIYYNNFGKCVKAIDVTFDEFKEHLGKINYDNFYEKHNGYNVFFENKTVPSFGHTFYRSLCEHGVLIRPVDELVDIYIDKYFIKAKSDTYILKREYRKDSNFTFTCTYNDIAGCCCRAYCSFCREVALYLYLSEKYQNLDVIYSYEYDVVYGIDLIVKVGNKSYGFAAYVNTKGGNEHRTYKKNTFYKKDKLETIDLPLTFNVNSEKVGDIYIYSLNYLDNVINSLL